MLAAIGWMDWPNMINDEDLLRGRHTMIRITPTFYMDEACANKFDRPRLDFLVEFNDGHAVRYHPRATSIWLPASREDTKIIEKRRERLQKVQRKYGRDWER